MVARRRIRVVAKGWASKPTILACRTQPGRLARRSPFGQHDSVRYGRVVTTGREQYQAVPHRVVERQGAPEVNAGAYRIKHAAGHDQNCARLVERGEEWWRGQQHRPAEREVQDDR